MLTEVSADFAPGRLTAVIGPSGSGKTTLLELIAGLHRPDAGRVRIGEAEMAGLGAEQRAALRRESIGYLRQEPSPVGHLSAVENVLLAMALHGRGRAGDAARDLLGALGLGARRRGAAGPALGWGGAARRPGHGRRRVPTES